MQKTAQPTEDSSAYKRQFDLQKTVQLIKDSPTYKRGFSGARSGGAWMEMICCTANTI